jgi:hypothetical protein
MGGSSSFVQAEFFDREQFRADPLNTKPFRIIISVPRAPSGAMVERLVIDDRLISPPEMLEAAAFTALS